MSSSVLLEETDSDFFGILNVGPVSVELADLSLERFVPSVFAFTGERDLAGLFASSCLVDLLL